MNKQEYEKAKYNYRREVERYRKKVKECSDLAEVIAEYEPIKKQGRKYIALCLWHNEHNASMEVDPEKGLCHCYSCNAGGDVFNAVMQKKGVDFNTAVDILAEKYNIVKPLPFAEYLKVLEAPDYKPTFTQNIDRATSTETEPAPPPLSEPDPTLIMDQQVKVAQAYVSSTSFHYWLCHYFDRTDVDRVFSAYRCGGSKFAEWVGIRAISFPYLDVEGNCIDCHLMHYDPNTGSSKKLDGERLPNSWAIAELQRSECKKCRPGEKGRQYKNCPDYGHCSRIPHRSPWCNFGDHLLKLRPNDAIGIVESEKSCLILSLAYPDIVWIATNGKHKLKPEIFEKYRGRDITVYPDRDGYDDKPRKNGAGVEKGWRTIARELATAGLKLYVDTTVENHYPKYEGTDENGEPKECKKDLADLVLDYRRGLVKPIATLTPTSTPEAIPKVEDPGPMPPPGTPEYSEWASQLAALICSRREGDKE